MDDLRTDLARNAISSGETSLNGSLNGSVDDERVWNSDSEVKNLAQSHVSLFLTIDIEVFQN